MHRVTINILCLVAHLVTELFRDAIPNTLMWPVLVEKVFVFIEYVFQSPDFFGKEVGTKKNVRMSGQELSPSQALVIWRRRQAVSPQDVRYGGFRNLNA